MIYFVNYCQSKNHQKRYKIKNYCTKPSENVKSKHKKNCRIKIAFSNYMGEMGMDNFSCLNSSLSLFCFYFVTSLRKKVYVCLQLNLPPPLISANTLLAGSLLLTLGMRTLWMTTLSTLKWKIRFISLHWKGIKVYRKRCNINQKTFSSKWTSL